MPRRYILLGMIAGVPLAAAWLAACSSVPPVTPTPSASSGESPPAAQRTPFPAALQRDAPYAPKIDPARFVDTVDNPYFPLVPGTRWVMRGAGEAEGEVTTTLVTERHRMILGVRCTVVRDEVRADGELQELTFDWYAQDVDGNVWYFGEDTAEYENGQITTRAGAWEAGVDGAEPGVIMPAQPAPGLTYRQEFLAGEAEDLAKVIALGQRARTPAGSFDDLLVTEDWTPLEPHVRERKFYAPGIGLVMERLVAGGSGTNRLTAYRPGR